MNYNDEDLRIEELREYMYPNPIDGSETHMVCPNCGENLYDGDVYYPRIGLCEHCLPDYKEKVELD